MDEMNLSNIYLNALKNSRNMSNTEITYCIVNLDKEKLIMLLKNFEIVTYLSLDAISLIANRMNEIENLEPLLKSTNFSKIINNINRMKCFIKNLKVDKIKQIIDVIEVYNLSNLSNNFINKLENDKKELIESKLVVYKLCTNH